jgi:hypothetical protein
VHRVSGTHTPGFPEVRQVSGTHRAKGQGRSERYAVFRDVLAELGTDPHHP